MVEFKDSSLEVFLIKTLEKFLIHPLVEFLKLSLKKSANESSKLISVRIFDPVGRNFWKTSWKLFWREVTGWISKRKPCAIILKYSRWNFWSSQWTFFQLFFEKLLEVGSYKFLNEIWRNSLHKIWEFFVKVLEKSLVVFLKVSLNYFWISGKPLENFEKEYVMVFLKEFQKKKSE